MLVTLRGQGLKRKQASSHQIPPSSTSFLPNFVWNIANTCTNPCKTNINQDNNQGSDLEIFIWKALAASHPPPPLLTQIPTNDITNTYPCIQD